MTTHTRTPTIQIHMHRHRYDDHGVEVMPIEHIGLEQWPTLGEVIEEVYDWWVVHRSAD